MGYRSNVKILVRTEDLENFKKTNPEQYKLAFQDDLECNTFEKYKADLEIRVCGYLGEENIVSEPDADLTLITFSDCKWDTSYEDVQAVINFVENLCYYEMLVVGEDGATEYTADDYTLYTGIKLLYTEVVVYVDAQKVA